MRLSDDVFIAGNLFLNHLSFSKDFKEACYACKNL